MRVVCTQTVHLGPGHYIIVGLSSGGPLRVASLHVYQSFVEQQVSNEDVN